MARPTTTDFAVLDRLVQPAGRDVLDVGCGAGALVRRLASAGARPVGLEISEAQIAEAIATDGGAGARYLVGRAEALPLEPASVDAVVFMRSLHHVPPSQLDVALSEAARVLRPAGIVYAAEPLAEGDYFELLRLVEDELEVRRAAQRALDDAQRAGFEREATVEYDVAIEIAGIEALRERVVRVDPDRAALFAARQAEIEQALARLGEPAGDGGAKRFTQPMRAVLLRRAQAGAAASSSFRA